MAVDDTSAPLDSYNASQTMRFLKFLLMSALSPHGLIGQTCMVSRTSTFLSLTSVARMLSWDLQTTMQCWHWLILKMLQTLLQLFFYANPTRNIKIIIKFSVRNLMIDTLIVLKITQQFIHSFRRAKSDLKIVHKVTHVS